MNEQQTNKVFDSKTIFWNRVQLLLVLAVFIAPIAGAIFYKPKSFNNYGDLYMPARQVENLTLTGVDEVVEFDAFRRQWLFLIVANGQCEKACEDNLLKIRQLRFMQNNNMTRIRTIFIHSELPEEVATDLRAKYSPVETYSVPMKAFNEWTQILEVPDAPAEAQENRFYIIDPAGNLMMSYPATADPNYIKKDIKRLLKTSQIG